MTKEKSALMLDNSGKIIGVASSGERWVTFKARNGSTVSCPAYMLAEMAAQHAPRVAPDFADRLRQDIAARKMQPQPAQEQPRLQRRATAAQRTMARNNATISERTRRDEREQDFTPVHDTTALQAQYSAGIRASRREDRAINIILVMVVIVLVVMVLPAII